MVDMWLAINRNHTPLWQKKDTELLIIEWVFIGMDSISGERKLNISISILIHSKTWISGSERKLLKLYIFHTY